MPKVITIKESVYKRLSKLKRRHNMSFSDAITFLLNFYESRKESTGMRSFAGSLREKAVLMTRLRRIYKKS